MSESIIDSNTVNFSIDEQIMYYSKASKEHTDITTYWLYRTVQYHYKWYGTKHIIHSIKVTVLKL